MFKSLVYNQIINCCSDLLDLDSRIAENPEEELSVRVYMQGLKLPEPLRYTFQDPVKHCLTNRFKVPDPVIFFSDHEPGLPSPPSPSYRELSGKIVKFRFFDVAVLCTATHVSHQLRGLYLFLNIYYFSFKYIYCLLFIVVVSHLDRINII